MLGYVIRQINERFDIPLYLVRYIMPKSYLNTIYYEYLFFVFKNKYDLCFCFINTLIIEL